MLNVMAKRAVNLQTLRPLQMYMLSIDIGPRNMGTSFMYLNGSDIQMVDWRNIDCIAPVTNGKGLYKPSMNVDYMYWYVNHIKPWVEMSAVVVIENQFKHTFQTLADLINICYYDKCVQAQPRVYKKYFDICTGRHSTNKTAAVDKAHEVAKLYGITMPKEEKLDDMADSFLQGVWWAREGYKILPAKGIHRCIPLGLEETTVVKCNSSAKRRKRSKK
jgi:hypothetical protein